MTYRKVIGYGLIAGMRVSEMQDMTPGEVLDYFIFRRSYDDARLGIRRE